MYSVLNVYLLDRFVGRFSYESQGGSYSFQYDPDYLANPTEGSLSYSLPLRLEAYGDETALNFFANLLPPVYVRKKLEKCIHISAGNVFGFLKALGGDCAGAVSLYPEGVRPGSGKDEIVRELDESEAVEILKSLRRRPLYANGETGYRYSGAGAQDKLIARVRDGRVFLPLYGTPSTHLVKPASVDFPDSVENEHFCQMLARRVGISAAESAILVLNGERYYATLRYDRDYSGGTVRRLHQEDFCQMLSVDPERKYEEQGGPTAAQCLDALRRMRAGLPSMTAFIDAIAFNFLIGNADAHAKNHSALYRGGRPTLAPLYDLVSTAVYPELSRDFAMSIGGARRIGKVGRADFERLAADCGISAKLVCERLDLLAGRIVTEAESLVGELDRDFPSDVYRRILDVIKSQVALVAS